MKSLLLLLASVSFLLVTSSVCVCVCVYFKIQEDNHCLDIQFLVLLHQEKIRVLSWNILLLLVLFLFGLN